MSDPVLTLFNPRITTLIASIIKFNTGVIAPTIAPKASMIADAAFTPTSNRKPNTF